MLWWALWSIKGGPIPLLMSTDGGPVQYFPHGIRQYIRRWAHVRAAGHHWRGRAWDIRTLSGHADKYTFVRLHFMRHVGRHHEVWAAFAHHHYLLSVLIHVR